MLGWWDGGAVPGAAHGGALVTGHTVHTGGGAFDDLETLRPGDPVRVRTARGTIRYAVTGVTVYRKASLARDAAKVFRQTRSGPAGADHVRGLERHDVPLQRGGLRRPGVSGVPG